VTEQFTSITFEAFINGSWMDITADVCHDPHPKWNRGVMDNGPLDRVGDPGYCRFDLNDSEANAAKLIGYYTPGHANCLANWKVGLSVRLGFGYSCAAALPALQSLAFALGTTIWDAAAAIFTSGTYAWAVYGTNTKANVSNELLITYVDNAYGAKEFLNNAADLSADLTVGQWYEFDWDSYTLAGKSVDVVINDGVIDSNKFTETGTGKTSHKMTFYANHATNCYIRMGDMGVFDVIYLDNLALKTIAISKMFTFPTLGQPLATSGGPVVVTVNPTVTVGMWAGLALACNSMAGPSDINPVPTSGIYVLINGASNQLRVDKFAAGVWTNIIAPTTITYGAGKALQTTLTASGANMLLDVKYDGLAVGTQQTITEAAIVAGAYHGVFRSDDSTTFANFGITPGPGMVYKYRGYIAPDGLITDPGIHGTRRVHVTCRDYAAVCSDSKLNLLGAVASQRVDQAIPYIIGNLPFLPQRQLYDLGYTVFPNVFDTAGDTAASAEFQKLCLSDTPGTFIAVIGDQYQGETLMMQSGYPVTGSRVHGGIGDLVLYNGATALFDNDMLLPGTRISYGKHYFNRIYGKAYPRAIDAAATTVLWKLNKSFMIPAGGHQVVRGLYRDPNAGTDFIWGNSMVPPVATTDYLANTAEDGGGTNKTTFLTVTPIFGAGEFSLDHINGAGVDIWVTNSQVRGKAVTLYDMVDYIYNDLASQLLHGVISLTLDMAYQPRADFMQTWAYHLAIIYSIYAYTIDGLKLWANRDAKNMLGFLQGEPGTQIAVKETMNAIDGHYYINGYDAEIIDLKYVYWTPILYDVEMY
jgi:hypothetical protein